MAASAFHLGGSAQIAQKEYKTFNAWSSGTGSCTFTAKYSGIAVFAISGNVGFFSTTMQVNGSTVANSWNSSDGFHQSGYDVFDAVQYAYGFATKQIKVKKGDTFSFTSVAQGSGGDSNTFRVAMYIVKG